MSLRKAKLETMAVLSTLRGLYRDAVMFNNQLQGVKEMEQGEKWDVKISYEVKGKEIYSDTQEWKGINPEKVGIMMGILREAQDKFIKATSSV